MRPLKMFWRYGTARVTCNSLRVYFCRQDFATVQDLYAAKDQ